MRANAYTGWAEIFDGAHAIQLVGYTVVEVGTGQAIDAGDFIF